ncbi:hypothetical protein [Flammeovirga sp. SJP92]|uniref:hypothetical protein n=1 Tax=Flammeovirga sp. SJP92 TaxID=1775430 RepID=UPI000787A14C|nr:hypothetical protein [Flammeovirga sp. SJP92]KXX70622.1 hypothetical protein AVL50_07310 [Flammeovirga sp. SJP92]
MTKKKKEVSFHELVNSFKLYQSEIERTRDEQKKVLDMIIEQVRKNPTLAPQGELELIKGLKLYCNSKGVVTLTPNSASVSVDDMLNELGVRKEK